MNALDAIRTLYHADAYLRAAYRPTNNRDWRIAKKTYPFAAISIIECCRKLVEYTMPLQFAPKPEHK